MLLVRDLSLFYKLFLIDVVDRHAVPLCPFVNSGIMHRDFQKFLRPDHLGIDYSHLLDYDTYSKIDKHFQKQHPYYEKQLSIAMSNKDVALLKETIANAERVQLHKKKPGLIEHAKQILNELTGQSGVRLSLKKKPT
jgi:hypothetical protein